MSELENDLSEKRPVKKKIIRKKIIKRRPGGESGEVVISSDTETRDEGSDIQKSEGTPVRRIIKRKGIVRKHARESVEEVLGKKIAPPQKEQEKIVEYKAAPVEEEINQDEMKSEGADEGDSSRVIRRRVVKKKPAIKRVIKKKAVTRRLARETIEQVLGKKLEGEEKREEEKPVKETAPEPVISALPKRKAMVTKKVSEDEPKERDIQKPVAPAVVIAPDWKEKKIACYKKKSKAAPIFSPLPKDTKLNERYKIMELIHSDCYGCVYRVTDLKEKNKDLASRAIKEIQYSLSDCNNLSGLQEAMNMLKRIASFLQDMSHPFLTKIYDYFFDIDEKKGARFFIVMELVEGRPLEDILAEYKKEGTSMSAKHIFKIISNICDAMYYSHNKKPFPIAFINLKPSNIIVADDDSLKFINYGMGRIIINPDSTSEYRGTLGYSAPEQKGVDFTNTKADIFAFGVTLYYLLSGINPEEYPYEFKSIKDTKPFISDKVENFIFKCVNVHPEDRPLIQEVRETIKGFDFFELDTSTEESKKIEEKRKKIEGSKARIVEPLDDIIGEVVEDEPKKPSKSNLAWILIPAIIVIIGIIIFIIVFKPFH